VLCFASLAVRWEATVLQRDGRLALPGRPMAPKCHRQQGFSRLASAVSSSGGGLPGRPGLARVSGRSLFFGPHFTESGIRRPYVPHSQSRQTGTPQKHAESLMLLFRGTESSRQDRLAIVDDSKPDLPERCVWGRYFLTVRNAPSILLAPAGGPAWSLPVRGCRLRL